MDRKKIVIGVDGMGGDNAPYPVIKACHMFDKSEGMDVILVGDEKQIKGKIDLEKYPFVSIQDCVNYIKMHEKVNLKLLREKENSMVRTIGLVKERKADCALSAGNTAAFVSYSISELGLLPGIDRPAIALLMPTVGGSFTIFLDGGANVKAKPLHLLQSAFMGSLYAEDVFGIKSPKVALLNIGEEETKGDDLRRAAFELLGKSGKINFTGNIEGQDFFSGKADVVITDGFTGNVVLKVSEGVARSFRTILTKDIRKSLRGKMGAMLMKNILKDFAKKGDYAEYGGGLLLGVNGSVIISHGRSSPRAVYSAIKLGKKIAASGFMEKLKNSAEGIKWEA
ncbi:MAG: phosphate acyltransferase PlsX [Candidatus Omnitrophica bacterium]|nr:phosphate acyltransferase PlsX [Candidatus Omnitrophota bacterium]